MQAILGNRGSGKTRQLIEYAINNKAIIICKNPYSIEEKAKGYGFTEPVTTLSYVNYRFNMDPSKKYVVDDLDEFVKYEIPSLEGFTLTVG